MATEVISVQLSSMEKDSVKPSIEMVAVNSEAQTIPSAKVESSETQGNNQPKKPHRRKPSKKKRKWKPYSKMTWEERKVLEEKEKLKAFRIREEMKEKGRPVAPYNTTQFLMEEHDPFDSDTFEAAGYNHSNAVTTGTDDSYSDGDQEGRDGGESDNADGGINGRKNGDKVQDASSSLCDGSMDEYTDSPHMEPEFISQDFSETYERVHEESLQTMSRDELMLEHIDLEQKLSVLQEELANSKRVQEKKIKVLETSVDNLRSDNARLLNENELLKSGKNSRMSTSDEGNVNSDNECENIAALREGDVMERR